VETVMMKKETLSKEEMNKYLQIVYDSSKKLSGLVEHLFQYAKLEANVIVPEKESFRLEELASDILMTYQLKAQEKKIQLHLNASNALPPVFADIALTERVLQNLLDNALKFTPAEGSITVEIVETNAGVKVQITDTGIGITPENQAFIFERYKQLEKGNSTFKGMGLGLAIAKKILELHQSSIEVSSTLGKGTTFRFVLPVVY
jgi:signal transduction histidine kinase